ncbi:polycomb group RING finger protein 3-like [Clavelina lepadiformis]|uniref:RING-type domain-containing protein n=1 Tax=Clavelina lepadiformis TaxID=159417 RepID=A0ABP0F759_CLALP
MELRRNHSIPLRKLNEHITCFICRGYLVDATTITECIHTFCRSCLVKHIEDDSTRCPKCNTVIHHSYPLQYIAHDRTMQDIVDKLVPTLKEREYKRRLKFCRENNLPLPVELDARKLKNAASPSKENGTSQNYHKYDEQIDIYLRSANSGMKHLKRPYLQCSVHVTIKILKKFIAKHLGMGVHHHGELDILCNNEILGKDHTLMFIIATRWRTKKPPILLEYRPRIKLL